MTQVEKKRLGGVLIISGGVINFIAGMLGHFAPFIVLGALNICCGVAFLAQARSAR